MDINLARTFLEVAAGGSFISAAERMHVTQTAVSARIRTLEDQLGSALFVRNKAGARLTVAGERFVRHATTLVQVWEQARKSVALSPDREVGVSIGGELCLWYPLLSDWLVWMNRENPDIALRAEVDGTVRLLDRVQQGTLDIAVLFNPPQRSDLVYELLIEEKLVLVTSDPSGAMDPGGYVYVDWGPSFAANHAAAFPELANPPVSISLGPLALTYLLAVGGSGYFRSGTAQPLFNDGRLHRVQNAPEFSCSAYTVYAARHEGQAIDRVRYALRAIAGVGGEAGIEQRIESRRCTAASDLE